MALNEYLAQIQDVSMLFPVNWHGFQDCSFTLDKPIFDIENKSFQNQLGEMAPSAKDHVIIICALRAYVRYHLIPYQMVAVGADWLMMTARH